MTEKEYGTSIIKERIDIGDGYQYGFCEELYKNDNVYWFEKHKDKNCRTDPNLIQVVEEMGEKANGKFAKLKIIEIPDNTEWTIEEYDGLEWIAEAHRTWD
jgi:hypothetical protein